MFYNAKGGTIQIGDDTMHYVTFGKGEKTFVILPGLSDGITTVHNKQMLLSSYYKIFAKDFKVYVLSRRNNLPDGYTTKDMADDLKTAMETLGIEKAHLMGISQGGMISQHFAINHPEFLDKLVLGVTIAKQNETMTDVIGSWVEMVKVERYKEFVIDTIVKTYTEKMQKKYKPAYPIIAKMNTPKDPRRFFIQANACLTHNAYDRLSEIKCPTLILGGKADKVVGLNTSEEIAAKIEGSKLIMYDGLGHGAYEESKDFNKQVLEFLL